MRAFAITLCAILIIPGIAWAADPFESAPAPQASPPKPAYHPRPPPRDDEQVPMPLPIQPPAPPAVAAVLQPPQFGDIQTRVRQVGQAQSIPIPLAASIRIDVRDTPQRYWPWLGAWGPAIWTGNLAGDRLILVVKSVDDAGTANVLFAQTSCCASGAVFQGQWTEVAGKIDNGKVAFDVLYVGPYMAGQYRNLTATFHYAFDRRADGKLYGSRGNQASTIVLSPLP
jgi:hypothetical protein